MSKKDDVYVVPTEKGWGTRRPNTKRLSKKFDTKADAVKSGTEMAKKSKSEITILKKNGKIQNKNSHGNDPNPPKDTKP